MLANLTVLIRHHYGCRIVSLMFFYLVSQARIDMSFDASFLLAEASSLMVSQDSVGDLGCRTQPAERQPFCAKLWRSRWYIRDMPNLW
ncbi:hypothetical protein CGRA01v4_11716 [Colletotrichum graminicola]|nr:hypothetical protein CGRA01v4_11716 [Colletotrichum graminicola]